MYEQHFGLRKRPFQARATGSSVFVGPQIAAAMAGLKKALQCSDAIATVSGPVGTGKTTLVLKALDAIAEKYKIIVIGRMRLKSDDVLELLLDELGVDNQPQGTIQKFNAFRRGLREFEESDTRIFVVVEDSARLGIETLAEIEALTAADSGVSEGTSVVLMGDEELGTLLADPLLSRLQQRTRQRLQTAPLCAAELRGYLRHCFRLAGGDFEQIFEANAPDLLHHLTGGTARVANTVLDAALTVAAEQGSETVSSELLARVAENEFGLSAADFDLTPEPVVAAVEPVDAVEPVEAVEPVAAVQSSEPMESAVPATASSDTESLAEPPEPGAELEDPEPVIVFADVAHEEDLPELIQDTLPELQVLQPDATMDALVADATPSPEPEMPAATPEAPTLPELEPEPAVELAIAESEPASEPESDTLAAWDRDPTMAELKPDLAALEEAMAFSHSPEPEKQAIETKPAVEGDAGSATSIPEITLDHAISQRIESQLIDEPGAISPIGQAPDNEPDAKDESTVATAQPNTTATRPAKADGEMEKIAAELARAKSLEDVDDRMAETLFGEELSLAASQFITAPVAAEPAQVEVDANLQTDQIVAEPVIAEQQVSAAYGSSADIEVTLQASQNGDEHGGLDLSASQRLKTVRALNADLHPSLRDPETPAANDSPEAAKNAPDSIEDQINVSMTQTLKALKMPDTTSEEDEETEKSKTGFFSRFKRS